MLLVLLITNWRWNLILVLSCISLIARMLSTFSYICWPFVCLLGRSVCSGPLPILSWIVGVFGVELYKLFIILDTISLELMFANIFSLFVGCLFVLLVVYFAVQKHFTLIQSYSFIFALLPLTLETNS